MTLRPKGSLDLTKIVNIDSSLKEFIELLEKIFHPTEELVDGMRLYQLTFDCCTAFPNSYSEKLLKAIVDYLTGYTRAVRKVRFTR
jgi:hypothetical protein